MFKVPSGILASSVSRTAWTVVARGCRVRASTCGRRHGTEMYRLARAGGHPTRPRRLAHHADEVPAPVLPDELLLAAALLDDRAEAPVERDVGTVRLVALPGGRRQWDLGPPRQGGLHPAEVGARPLVPTCRAPDQPPPPSSRWRSPSGARRATCGRPRCGPRSAPRWAAPA